MPQMRALAETVWRLVRRDKSQTAVHLVSRVLSELELGRSGASDREQRAYLLNLRGVVYAQKGQESAALLDLEAAVRESPGWAVPLYNIGLCHKAARRWTESAEALDRGLLCLRKQAGRWSSLGALSGQGGGLGRALLQNLGIAQAAQGKTEAARATWQACGQTLGRSGQSDLGLAQLSLPTQGPYSIERVWVQRLDPARARILSVVRYGAPCQFGDIVLCDNSAAQTGYSDGLVATEQEEGEGEEPTPGLIFLDTLESAGYALHVVQGGVATPAQAMALTERMREAGLHIEVWSLTMRLPGGAQGGGETTGSDERAGTPLCAGLVLPEGSASAVSAGTTALKRSVTPWPENSGPIGAPEAQRIAERAVGILSTAGRDLGVAIYAPSLMASAGDELGAARHRRALRRGSAGVR